MGKGFTLIELIVVIAIIAILAAIIAPNAFRAIEKAKIADVISTLKSLQSGMLAYYTDTGVWMYRHGQSPPSDCPGWVGWGNTPSGCPYPYSVDTHTGDMGYMCNYCTGLSGWDGPYLENKVTYTPWNQGWYHINTSPGHGRFFITRVPSDIRQKIDELMDDGVPSTGSIINNGDCLWCFYYDWTM